jgi:hypothetical protein
MVLIGLVVTATLLFSGRGMAAAQDGGGQVGAQACVAPCLYDQLTPANDLANGWISQNFLETTLNAADNQAADDFTIPPGSFFWSVNKIEVDGFYQEPGYQAASVNIYFYSNAGSLPGPNIVAPVSVIPSANLNNGDFVMDLNPPVGLVAGHTYWLSVQANLDAGQSGSVDEWFWGLRGPQTANAAVWQNAQGGFIFGTPCTNWGPLATCGGSDPGTTTDLQFRLSGSKINIAATVYLPLISR